MHLPPDLHNRLKDELRLAVTKMAEADTSHQKLYYFSVFFGETVRILNWHWENELALIWAISQVAHNSIVQTLAANNQGEPVIQLTGSYFNALTREATALVEWVEKEGEKEELCEIVGSLAKITYAATGNGFYLLGKGHITLED